MRENARTVRKRLSKSSSAPASLVASRSTDSGRSLDNVVVPTSNLVSEAQARGTSLGAVRWPGGDRLDRPSRAQEMPDHGLRRADGQPVGVRPEHFLDGMRLVHIVVRSRRTVSVDVLNVAG